MEVDILVDFAGKIIPIEVKLSATPRPEMASSIKMFLKDFGEKSMRGYVVHGGNVQLPLGSGVIALPYSAL
jgi:hypothetical protein